MAEALDPGSLPIYIPPPLHPAAPVPATPPVGTGIGRVKPPAEPGGFEGGTGTGGEPEPATPYVPPTEPKPEPTPPTPTPPTPEPEPAPPGGGGGTEAVETVITGQAFVSALRAYADLYGVDPLATSAVAMWEMGSGGIGDGGTAFGPWQMHLTDGNGPGDLTKFLGRPPYDPVVQAWAWSKPGIAYAILWQANDGARNLTGLKAVHAIVYGFEKPANKPLEYEKASANYQDLLDQGGAVWSYLATVFKGPAAGSAPPNPTHVEPIKVTGLIGTWDGFLDAAANVAPAAGRHATNRGKALVSIMAAKE